MQKFPKVENVYCKMGTYAKVISKRRNDKRYKILLTAERV